MATAAVVTEDVKPDPSEGEKSPASKSPPPPVAVETIPAPPEVKQPAAESKTPPPPAAPTYTEVYREKKRARWFEVYRLSWWFTDPNGQLTHGGNAK